LSFDISSILLIVTAAVLAPMLAALIGRYVPFPLVVVELLIGILIGPQVLGIAKLDELASFFGTLGLAFLFLFAGYEIDFARIRGTPLRLGLIGWGVSLALAYSLSGVLHASGLVISGLLTGSAIATTAIGTLMPILRDAGLLRPPLGPLLLAAGAVGELGPILIITLLLTGTTDEAVSALLLVAFVAVTVATAVAALRAPPRFWTFVHGSMDTSGQLPVRMTVALMIGLVALAQHFGLDLILGAFAAGVIVKLVLRDVPRETYETKLDALAYGFAIPAFFITSGMAFDVDALTTDPTALLKVPLFLGLFLVVRGLPALQLYQKVLPQLSDRISLALFSATQLPLVVAITTIGVQTDRMRTSTAAALVGAGMLSTLLFPLMAIRVAKGVPGRPVAAPPASAPAQP
jgi:Kef-type K+ transport system membrane component KefB